jgi:predicted glycosyltransferase/glycosyltransferase involved in cell wall biosynthesis
MRTFFHILISSIDPEHGGMEESAARIAGHFLAMGRTKVAVYTRAAHACERPSSLVAEVDFIPLYPQMQEVFSALSGDAADTQAETYRLAKNYFVQQVGARIQDFSDLRHVIVSFYISSTGFIAQHAASELGIPHIASVRGTDFNKDFFNPYRFSGVEFVAKNANSIVTTSENQRSVLRRFIPEISRIKTIYNSIDYPLPDRAPRTTCGTLELISDCGFSYKKCTQVLFDAFERTCNSDSRIRLTIVGSIANEERAFWDKTISSFGQRLKGRLRVLGHIPKSEVIELLRRSDIYVSASLGEGCSNGQLAALAMGMPIVSTRTGALPEIAANAPHVMFCEPGDALSLSNALSLMIAGTRSGNLVIDNLRVASWRELVNPERERYQWEQVVANILPKRDSIRTIRQGRVLFFVHDGTGLGHLRRVSRLAGSIQGPCASLVVSGHRQASFIVPPECELVHIPSLESLLPNKARYWGRKPFLDVPMGDALALRNGILKAVFSSFQPDIIVVDYLPLGKHNELYELLKESTAKLYFIMRGVLDHPDNVRVDLLGGSGESFLETKYDRLLVAADKRICNVVEEYGLSDKIGAKTEYIGYISEPVQCSVIAQMRAERGLGPEDKWIVCSAGGGALGEMLIEECMALPERFDGVFFDIVVGPRTAKQWPYLTADMHDEGRVRTHRECPFLAQLHAAADIVICAGGYNSTVEAMEGRARIITCPVQLRTNDEQFIHARRLSEHYPIRMVIDLHNLEDTLRETLTDLSICEYPPPARSVLDFDGSRRFRKIVLDDLALRGGDDIAYVRR